MTMDSMRAVRIDLAKRSSWNIGYFVSGLVFWLYVAIVAASVPLEVARIYWLVGTFFIFPVAVLASRLLGVDPFSKGNALGEFVGYTHMSVITLTFPIVLASFLYFPEAMVLIMAILYCVDFYVMTWAFGSRIFGIHAAARVVAVTAIWFALPTGRDVVVALTVAVAYLVTVALIPPLRRRWLAANAAGR